MTRVLIKRLDQLQSSQTPASVYGEEASNFNQFLEVKSDLVSEL